MKRVSFIPLCVCLLAAAPSGSGAQAVPALDALQAKIAAAAGRAPASSFERIAYTRFGATGTRTIVRAGDDVRETTTEGGITTARGTVGGQHWYQNANGQTVVVRPQPPDPVEDDVSTTVTRVSAPRDAYVIRRRDAAGNGSNVYVDPVTYRVVRRDDVGARENDVTTYDDFRTVDGFTTAWHWSVRDGRAEDTVDYRIDALVARPVDSGEVAIAPPRRALVTFPADESSVVLPARLVDGRFIVTVTVAGRDLDFLLDTGASGIALDDGVARRLGLPEVAHFAQAEDSGRFVGSWVTVPEMRVGALQMRDVVVSTLPSDPDRVGGATRVVGVLGFDFLAESVFELDYEKATVTAMHADLSVAGQPRGSALLDVRLDDGVPLVPISVNGCSAERFVLDTGDTAGLIVFDRFARRFPQALADQTGGAGALDREEQLSIDAGARRWPEQVVQGAANRFDVRPYLLANVRIGGLIFTKVIAYRELPHRPSDPGYDGLFGEDKLRFFTVWLDYGNARVLLTPNAGGRAAMK